MRELIGAGVTFVVLAAALLMGAGIMSKTYTVVNASAPSTTLNTVNTDTGSSITTFTGFLSIVAIALVGGLALWYMVSYLGGLGGQGR